jgi:hypothetical protein
LAGDLSLPEVRAKDALAQDEAEIQRSLMKFERTTEIRGHYRTTIEVEGPAWAVIPYRLVGEINIASFRLLTWLQRYLDQIVREVE